MDWDTNGKLTKKLLYRTTSNFLLFAVIILVVSAPIFYFVGQALYIYEADEVLIFHKEDFLRKSRKNHFNNDDIIKWNNYNSNKKVIGDIGLKEDSIFSNEYFDPTSREKEPFRELWAPVDINGKKYTYTEKNNLVVMEGMVLTIAVLFLLVISLLMIGIIWLSKHAATKLWAPFYNTLDQIKSFELDKSIQPMFPETEIEEFSRLNKSLERLIEKNVVIFKSQREFIENAAHELQTPLALFQTKIDSLSQLNITKEQSLILESMHLDVARLNRLNKNLLLFSKIENDTYFDLETFVLNDYLNKNFAFFVEQAAVKNIEIITDYKQTITLTSNPILLDVFINNLFLNAIRHNVNNGKIVIALGDNSLSFTNTGIAKALDEDRMFNRFGKIDPLGKGNGLGLAIIKKVSDLNGWQIGYRFADDLHVFIVTF